jgi:single-strand DNA-binding protein
MTTPTNRVHATRCTLTNQTEWFTIIVWRKLAEICERYLHKGSKVYLEVSLTQRTYIDLEDVGRTSFEVIASDMEMLSQPSLQQC